MTAHVDFTSIRRAGEDAGLATLGLVTQSQFLETLGIAEALQPPPEAAGLEEYAARRRAVTELLDPAGLGRLRVLVQAKGVEGASLTGLAPQMTTEVRAVWLRFAESIECRTTDGGTVRPFDYYAPQTLDEAVALLHQLRDGARPSPAAPTSSSR